MLDLIQLVVVGYGALIMPAVMVLDLMCPTLHDSHSKYTVLVASQFQLYVQSASDNVQSLNSFAVFWMRVETWITLVLSDAKFAICSAKYVKAGMDLYAIISLVLRMLRFM